MTQLTAVAAHGHTAVLDETSRSQALQVLFGRLGPALRHLRTAGLGCKLDGQHELALGVANQVDDGLVGSNLLLESDQVDLDAIRAKSRLDIRQAELVVGSAGVGLQTEAEDIKVLSVGGIDEGGPGIFGGQLGNIAPVDGSALVALKSLVTFLLAQLADHGVGRAAASRVAFNAAGIASPGERTLDALVRAVSLVVADLTAVEAFARQPIALGLARALASEVTGLVAATYHVSMLDLVCEFNASDMSAVQACKRASV